MKRVALAAVVVCSGMAFAQDRAKEDASPLAGPKVAVAPEAKSLVKREYGGALVKLELRPERAAIDLLGLSDDERKPVDQLFMERAKAVSTLLQDHLSLFLEIQGARQAAGAGAPSPEGERPRDALAPKIRELRELAAPLVEPMLADQVAAKLPEGKVAEFRRLVKEYTDAFGAETQKDRPGAKGDEPMSDSKAAAPSRPIPARRMETNLFIREIARTLASIVDERKKQTEELLATVQATPEQEAKIRAVLRGAGNGNGMRPTEEQRAETMRRVMDILTPDQRRALIRSRRPD